MRMDRRGFLKHTGNITLLSIAAFSFGCSIQPMVKSSERIALIYGTRYGATEDTASWIARGIGTQVDVLNIETLDFKEIVYYDKVIIGSGIWIDGPHKRLMELLQMKKEQIEAKLIASFIVCGTTGDDEAGRSRIESYFERFHKPLAIEPVLRRHFGGRMIIEKLSDKDRKLLSNFYKKVLKREFVSWDRTDREKAEQFGVELQTELSTEAII